MGKQVVFFMTPEDERRFVEFVRSDRNVGIFMSSQESRDIAFLDDLPTSSIPGWFALVLWDRDNSPPPVWTYVEKSKQYIISFADSEVIDFLRSTVVYGRIQNGRIWAEFNMWRPDEPDTIIRKSKSFEKWFDRLASWIRRHGVNDPARGYLLPGAQEFFARGKRS